MPPVPGAPVAHEEKARKELLAILPDHTSASQLATYARCPRQYRYRYVEGRAAERFSTNLALGSAVGSAIAWWFEAQRSGESAEVEGAARVFRADLAAALARPDVDWDGETLESLAGLGEKLLGTFLAAYGDLPVLRTEERIELPLVDPDTGEPMPRPLLGYLDFVLPDGSAIELKTAARSYSDSDLRTNLQFAGYRTVMRARGAGLLRLVVLVKTKTPKIQDVALEADRRIEAWFLRAAVQIERAILSGQFPPAPGMACSMCDYPVLCAGDHAELEEAADAAAAE